jgi:hypothetical protein
MSDRIDLFGRYASPDKTASPMEFAKVVDN